MNVFTGFIHRSLTLSSNFIYRNHLHWDSNLGHFFVVACFCKLLFKTNNFGLVVEVLGFGAVWIFKSIPTFWRNMLSPASEKKWRQWEVEWFYRVRGREGWESGPIREASFSLSRSRNLLICDMKEWKQALTNSTMSTSRPWKGLIPSFSSLSIPYLASPLDNMLGDSLPDQVIFTTIPFLWLAQSLSLPFL